MVAPDLERAIADLRWLHTEHFGAFDVINGVIQDLMSEFHRKTR
ncbi:MAG: hypothetical protein AB7Q29_11660 [Vicinamibacterales bacterium]